MGAPKTILALTDLSPASFGAVEQAATLAASSDARMVLAHVIDGRVMMPRELWRPPDARERTLANEHAVHALERIARRFGHRRARIECLVTHGDPREEITKLARRVKAQLIVLAQARCYLGSAVETVLRNADVPVLVAPRSEPAGVTHPQPPPATAATARRS
jgi:nucleotide-binding universal stress UspA family protein